MLNLFSIFDPHMGFSWFNWSSSTLVIFILPLPYWVTPSRMLKFLFMILMKLWSEFKLILTWKFNTMNLLILINLLINIMINNLMGLFPYIFTSTSHIPFSLLFSLSMWMGLMFFGWINNTNFMFSHLVPLGTPFMLMFFMVLIETLSNIIRPLTLAVRLTANMIAGHLLLTLLSSTCPTFMYMYIMIFFSQFILMSLEVAVSIIQAYVYVILLTLYLKETNYDKI